MSKQVKKVRQAEPLPQKSRGIKSRASQDLRRLQSLLLQRGPRQEAAGQGKANGGRASRSQDHQHPPKDTSRPGSGSDTTSEAAELEKFSITYEEERCFSSHPLHPLFSDIFTSLVQNRLCSEWLDHAPPESALRVLVCLRLLIRDAHYQNLLHQLRGVHLLSRYMESVAAVYLSCGEQACAGQTLVIMTYVFQKLSAIDSQKVWVVESGAHQTLVKLLSATDNSVLLGVLLSLTALVENPECKEEIGALPIVENLLVMLQEHDLPSKTLSAELLRLLSPVRQVRSQVRALGGLSVLLGLLSGQNLKLLRCVAWVLVQLCEDPDTRMEIRSWGGVQQLLRLLHSDRRYVSTETPSSIQKEDVREEASPQEGADSVAALQSACCAVLTELSLDDASAHHVVQENGVYIIAKLILLQSSGPTVTPLQLYAFRTLRFLFSVERNRHLFKRLLPTDLFEMFIDVGHYVRDLTAYEGLRSRVSLYTEEEMDSLRESIQAVDQNRPPLRVISGYSILDHLGTGAFGSVFKVRKQSGQNLLALKEVDLHNPAFGKDKKSRDSNVEKIVSELTIIKEQMAHPNIVKYYKTFLEGERLYVVMELIEGVPLAEHFSSLKEKQQNFTEDRMWKIFIQMCLALRYLHKEKRIIHRDLSPNNIMLGEKDKVTITDFGLAKQKQENSKLTSVVGTILYSCPELVKNEPYGEKADVWALGCILYQMAALQPPFYSSNMLSLASKIVEADYEPIGGAFSDRISDMIRWCLSPGADQRPDIVAISSRISDLMMKMMDGLYTSQNALERRAERDRMRAQQYFLERQKSRTSCCHSNPTQEISPTPRCSEGPDHPSDGDICEAKAVKPRPVSAGICVSQKTVRQIDDPIQRLLLLLHKIVYITQLPPPPQHDAKRRVVERFKKSLFQSGSDPYDLKAELSKLLLESPELMALGSTGSDWFPLVHVSTGDAHAADGTGEENLRDGVTYQQMKGLIEELLVENSYYEARHRTTERENK
ncbi:serine/threonine-protein kinase Nek10 [Antennarius striatus]|uniref:serine/threonine-protein kinase Nek10 n=1 Tax=Antennarius striatus TaxID=241820 RepID=UPI0035B01752